MTKTERTAKRMWLISHMTARGSVPSIRFEDMAGCFIRTYYALARWHLRALARQKRQWINRVCDSEVLWAKGERRNQVSSTVKMLTKERKV